MIPNIDLDGLLRRLHLPTIQRLHAELAMRAEKEEIEGVEALLAQTFDLDVNLPDIISL